MSYIRRLLANSGIDAAAVVDDMKFLTTEKLGQKQSLTPEGFLLIEDTPVARTGVQIYAPQEIPLHLYDFAPPPDGVYRVHRDEAEVFSPETVASANGKPLVDEHPEAIVTPDTHDAIPGVMMSPRRGTGVLDDLLVADVMVYSKHLIQLIRDGKRELSCGYDVDYEEVSPGVLRQKNIRINHVALVDTGRCGPRCSIGDRNALREPREVTMSQRRVKKGVSVFDRIRLALMRSSSLSAKDKEELEKALEEEEVADAVEGEITGTPHPHHIEIHNHGPATGHDEPPAGLREAEIRGGTPEHDAGEGEGEDLEARVARLETAIHELAELCKTSIEGVTSDIKAMRDEVSKVTPESVVGEAPKEILGELELEAPTGAQAADVKKAKDSSLLKDSFQATAALADILAPGIRLPAFDAAVAPAVTFKAISDLRRSALEFAYAAPDTRGMIDEVLGGRAFDAKGLAHRDARSLFKAVGAMKRSANNSRTSRVGAGDQVALEQREHGKPVGAITNLTAYGEMLKKHYA